MAGLAVNAQSSRGGGLWSGVCEEVGRHIGTSRAFSAGPGWQALLERRRDCGGAALGLQAKWPDRSEKCRAKRTKRKGRAPWHRGALPIMRGYVFF